MKKSSILLTKDGSHTIFLPELDESYHSTHGAIQESNHVFISEGLEYYSYNKGVKEISIIEMGFGTGLNALLSALFANNHNIRIDYETIEPYPLDHDLINELNYSEQLEHFLAEEIFKGIHEARWNESVSVHTDFCLKKIKQRFQDYKSDRCFDICFYDAFSPSKQPDMWEKPLLQKVYDVLSQGGVFVTYCAKGQLKRDLTTLGFEVDTIEGPPGKMQMVRAIKT